MTGSPRHRLASVAACAAAATFLLSTGVVWAAPEGRIQQVQSTPGVVDFVLSAEGLTEGESINPESVNVTIAGFDAESTASSISESAVAPARTVMLTLDASGSMGYAPPGAWVGCIEAITPSSLNRCRSSRFSVSICSIR